MSYYDDLGIDKNASKDQIKKAYLSKASKHHPDKQGGSTTDKLIKLSDYGKTATMQDTNLGIGITSTIQSDLKKFNGNLNSLLEHVYFHTEPMENSTFSTFTIDGRN